MKTLLESINNSILNLNESVINNIKQFKNALKGTGFEYLAEMDPQEVHDLDDDEIEALAKFVTSDEYMDIIDSFSNKFSDQQLSRLEEIENNIR